jgi:hypothetical protein
MAEALGTKQENGFVEADTAVRKKLHPRDPGMYKSLDAPLIRGTDHKAPPGRLSRRKVEHQFFRFNLQNRTFIYKYSIEKIDHFLFHRNPVAFSE